MDRHFLEFWGNFLIQAAKGQQQFDDMARWMGQGMRGTEDLSEMFRKAYGLDGEKKDTPEHQKRWEQASKDFITSFEEWLGLAGMVSREEHQALVEKYDTLKKKAASHEETIKHLQMLLAKEGHPASKEVTNFQDLMQEQADQFHKLMQGIGDALKKDGNDA